MSYRGLGEKSGVNTLLDWARRCEGSGGRVNIATYKNHQALTNSVIARCWRGKAAGGGEIKNIPPSVVQAIRAKSKGKGKVDLSALREILSGRTTPVPRFRRPI